MTAQAANLCCPSMPSGLLPFPEKEIHGNSRKFTEMHKCLVSGNHGKSRKFTDTENDEFSGNHGNRGNLSNHGRIFTAFALPTRRPADLPTGRPTGRPADLPTGRPADLPTCRPADRPADPPTCRPVNILETPGKEGLL